MDYENYKIITQVGIETPVLDLANYLAEKHNISWFREMFNHPEILEDAKARELLSRVELSDGERVVTFKKLLENKKEGR